MKNGRTNRWPQYKQMSQLLKVHQRPNSVIAWKWGIYAVCERDKNKKWTAYTTVDGTKTCTTLVDLRQTLRGLILIFLIS